MPGVNSVDYPVRGNKCRLVVDKNDFEEALKHMIYTCYQSMVRTDNNTNTMDSSGNPSHIDHDNSMVDSNRSAQLISPCMIPVVTFVKEEC